eukprot:353214-Chlamydomonas_euryale.AAC.4
MAVYNGVNPVYASARPPSLYLGVKLRRGGPCTKHVLRPQVKAYHACRGRGRPDTEDMHARKCPRPKVKGHVRACMSEAEGRPRQRQARQAETVGRVEHVLCKDDPVKVSQKNKCEDRPLMLQHRWDLWSSKCMHERTHMHQHACCIILVYK